MLGFILMLAVAVGAFYLMFFKFYPAIAFRYTGAGERKGRAEYQRIKREHPDSPEARVSEAEFVDRFVRSGPSPWKYVLGTVALLLIGLPASCVIGIAGLSQ